MLNTFEPLNTVDLRRMPIVTKTQEITNEMDIENFAIELRDVIISRNASFLKRDSHLIFLETESITINVAKANLLAARG